MGVDDTKPKQTRVPRSFCSYGLWAMIGTAEKHKGHGRDRSRKRQPRIEVSSPKPKGSSQ